MPDVEEPHLQVCHIWQVHCQLVTDCQTVHVKFARRGVNRLRLILEANDVQHKPIIKDLVKYAPDGNMSIHLVICTDRIILNIYERHSYQRYPRIHV